MALINIRAALEQALGTISPAISTAYENAAFTPAIGVPYQAAFLLQGTPQNPTLGAGFYRAVGIFQINVMYPIQAGTAAAVAQAEKIQALFARGQSFAYGGLTVRILTTPTIGAGTANGDRWQIPVKVSYFADVFG